VLRQQHRFFRNVLMATDVMLVVGADVAAYALRFDLLTSIIPPKESVWFDLYAPRRDQRLLHESAAILRAVVVGVAMVIAFLSLFRNVLFDGRHFSGWQFAIFAALCTIGLVAWRALFRAVLHRLRSRGWNLRHVAIVGTGRLGQLACKTLRRNSWTGIKPAYFISHHPKATRETCLDLPVLGGLLELDEILDTHPVSGVLIALPGPRIARLPNLLPRLERHPVDVRIVPDTNPRYMPINMTATELDGMPVLSLRESPMNSGWGPIIKRLTDVVGGLLALVVFAVPMLVIALLVRRSGPGPVIFRQERMSLNGQRFEIFKFRTMKDVDAEQQALRDSGRGTEAWTRPDDARITRIGRFLRRTSLDELPQLLNVILGEMSLVGPRPERPELIQRFRDDWRGYMLRQNVKAGMTGWAQVNGLRGHTSLRKRLQYDLFYVRNWSLLFDLRILALTLVRGFAHPNAN
jgi:Undecaprenyl-phosphate glucose phosphotransferase